MTIVRPFAVGKFKVTVAEWDACFTSRGCKKYAGGAGIQPVTEISWYEAKEYAAWLSRKTGKSYRLLSEAEWEYATRASNKLRLNDMVAEWVEDNWHPNYQGAPLDGSVWSGGDAGLRVVRGGLGFSSQRSLRLAERVGLLPAHGSITIGFRLARSF